MSCYRSISVLSLIRGRQVHFDHLLAGLAAQTREPDELVVAYMQDDPPELAHDPLFPVHFVHVEGEELMLAAARNCAAKTASGDILAFLDVDCIPDREFVRRISEAFENGREAVYLPEVRYLPARDAGWLNEGSDSPAYALLQKEGERHPAKPEVSTQALMPITDYGELWGLAFALLKTTWSQAGGMDEAFEGYGAEETDFAQRLAQIETPMFWLGGTICYHQHHPVHKPPLQHFASIIRNARLFHERWGKWCMDYWLDDFEKRGLIARHAGDVRVLRKPTAAEIASTRQGPEVRFS